MDTFLYALRSFDGPFYYITAVLCVIFIMAIIGFLMERSLKMEEAEALKRAGAFNVDLSTENNQVEQQAVEDIMKPVTPGIIDFTESTKKEEAPLENLETTTPTPEIKEAPIATNDAIPEIK